MQTEQNELATSRRRFVVSVAAAMGGLALTSKPASALGLGRLETARLSAAPGGWADRIGLELYTVRDMTAKDYLGTLEKVAAIGYKEVEPAGGYGNLSPKQFRAELDRLGLTMPSTHSGITVGPVADVEKRLADFQIMGIQYTSLDQPRPTQRRPNRQVGRRAPPPRTVDDVKQEAARYNEYGKVAQKFGMKLLIHNHTAEFTPCADSTELPYTILLADTDPALVVFQMDIGWASVAGQDPIGLFHQHPGRFVLWHVKDVAGLKWLSSLTEQSARMAEARLVPVGNGDIDYGEIFKHAAVAGMKHFAIEQDSAAEWGDSIAAARVSYEHLRASLTAESGG